MLLYKVFGVLGLIAITYATFSKKQSSRDLFLIGGGMGLLVYSISLKDPLFIPLQIIFILAAGYHLYQLKRNHK